MGATALEFLEAGYGTPSLADLALGYQRGAPPSALCAALGEAGISLPSPSEASLWLARDVADRVVSGELTPYEGGRIVWKELSFCPRASPRLTAFKAYASEIEDSVDPGDKDHYERLLLLEFQELLDRAGGGQSG